MLESNAYHYLFNAIQKPDTELHCNIAKRTVIFQYILSLSTDFPALYEGQVFMPGIRCPLSSADIAT